MKEVFDFQKFIFRTRLKQREIAQKTGASAGLVGNWSSGKAVPSYKNIARLIEAGMTAEELFGVEIAQKLFENSRVGRLDENADVRSVVKEVLSDMGVEYLFKSEAKNG